VELRSTRFALFAERTMFATRMVRLKTRTHARSESQSEVHGKCNSVGRRRGCRPIETDWQVCLDEVGLEQAVVMLDGPAFINQGRKSHRGVIYDERRS
jgi:hypothetical protein